MMYLRFVLLGLVLWISGCELTTPLDSTTKEAIQENLADALEDSDAEHRAFKQDYEKKQAALLDALENESDASLDLKLLSSRDRFNLEVEEMDAASFFKGLVADTEINILVHPEVEGTISLSLRDVNLDQVLEAVGSIYDYHIEKQSFGYKVYPVTLRTEVYDLNYLNITRKGLSNISVNSGEISSSVSGGGDSGSQKSTEVETESVTDFWVDIKDMLVSIVGNSDGRVVVTNPLSGTVVVNASPKEHRVIRRFLSQAHANLRRQVIIEAKILEVELNESFQSGVNWAVLSRFNGNAGSVVGGVVNDNFLSGVAFDASGLAQGAGQLSAQNESQGIFTSAVQFGDFSGLIELLETQGEVHVLSSPRISTVNNQKAVIKVGEDEFFVTEFSNNQTTTGDVVQSSPEVTLTPFFSGIALDVTPQIGSGDEIILHIHPSVTQVDDRNKIIRVANEEIDLPLALSRIRESDSVVKARNNQIIVIGGLLQTSSTDNDAKTPWLSSIPILGSLFSQKRQSSTKSELVILLRPIVPEQSGWSGQLPSGESFLPNIGQPIGSTKTIFR